MLETPAKLISNVFAGLGQPEPELLQEGEIARVVFRKLAQYVEGIRQSDQNLMATVTSEFTLSSGSNTKDLTALTSSAIITPLWCERKIIDSGNDTWEFVPTVNLDSIQERRFSENIAVSYYGSTANQITAIFSAYGDETDRNTFRVWYSPTNTWTNNKDATLPIPDNLISLVEVDAQISCIPVLVVNASKYLDKRPELAARIGAWEKLAMSLQQEKMEWSVLYEKWTRRSRGAHRAIDFNDVLGYETNF